MLNFDVITMKNDILKSKCEILRLNIFEIIYIYILCIYYIVSKNKFSRLYSISFFIK